MYYFTMYATSPKYATLEYGLRSLKWSCFGLQAMSKGPYLQAHTKKWLVPRLMHESVFHHSTSTNTKNSKHAMCLPPPSPSSH